MASEIPPREVITAIGDADFEDYVAQLMYSQGFSVVQRCVDVSSLVQILQKHPTNGRYVLIYKSDFEGIDNWLATTDQSGVVAVSLDGIALNAHAVMTHLRGQLRLPLLHNVSHSVKDIATVEPAEKFNRRTVSVTGTLGSPGRSFLAMHIAQQVQSLNRVDLIDADLREPSLAYLCGIFGVRVPLTVVSQSERTTHLPESSQHRGEVRVVDMGPLPSLADINHDQRWQANLLLDIIGQTTQMIFVVDSSGMGLLRLERFMRDFPVILRKVPVLYLLNKSGNSKEDMSVRERFLALTSGESQAIVPRTNLLIGSGNSKWMLLPELKRGNPFDNEIARIAKVVAA